MVSKVELRAVAYTQTRTNHYMPAYRITIRAALESLPEQPDYQSPNTPLPAWSTNEDLKSIMRDNVMITLHGLYPDLQHLDVSFSILKEANQHLNHIQVQISHHIVNLDR